MQIASRRSPLCAGSQFANGFGQRRIHALRWQPRHRFYRYDKAFTKSTSVQLARNFKTSAQQSPAEQSSSFSTGGNCEATDQQQVLNTVKQQAVHQHLRYQQTRRKNHWSCWHQPSQSQQQTEQSHHLMKFT